MTCSIPFASGWRPEAGSVAELLAHNALVEAVARVEQHAHADSVIHPDVDGGDLAHFIMIGNGGDRPFLRLQHLDADMRAVRQERAVPAPRPERADRSK